MSSSIALETETTTGLCAACGVPLDSQYFDVSSVQDAPALGEELLLARFELPAQYCGVLQYFSQFTDRFGKDFSQVGTPDLEWRILTNGQAMFPYFSLRHIVNPWGYGSFPVNIRLDEDSIIEFVVRGIDSSISANQRVASVGGRLVGRFWYNAAYGDVVKLRS
ncbi:MAG TPA: hypothetical protein VIG25_04835 [Pyrinomonadaceae bacterium]|jgi:hypothetical protein